MSFERIKKFFISQKEDFENKLKLQNSFFQEGGDNVSVKIFEDKGDVLGKDFNVRWFKGYLYPEDVFSQVKRKVNSNGVSRANVIITRGEEKTIVGSVQIRKM